MHPAYSVIIFSTLSGAGYGLLALGALAGAAHGPTSSFAFGALVMAIGEDCGSSQSQPKTRAGT